MSIYKADKILSFAVLFQMIILMFQQLLIDANIFEHNLIRPISILLSAIPMTCGIYIVFKKRLLLALYTYFIILFFLFYTQIFFPDNLQYINSEIFYLICMNIPCFLCIASIENFEILKKSMLHYAHIIMLLCIIYLVFIIQGKIVFREYSMSLSYYILLPSLLYVLQGRLLYFILYLLNCIIMLMLGSRGALVISCIFLLLIILIDRSAKKYIVYILLFIFIVQSSSITYKFLTLSDKIGIQSRTLSLMMARDYAHDSGRKILFNKTWNSILERPLSGHGLYGDRLTNDGAYCHNILLELYSHFGFLLGSFLVLLLIYFIIYTYIKSNFEERKFFLIFLFCGLLPLFVSGSYLRNAEFGIFLGVLSMFWRRSKTYQPRDLF